MKWITKVVAGFLVVLMSCSVTKSNETVTVSSNPSSISSIEKDVVERINDYRRKIGLKPLKVVGSITNEAEEHSADMASRRTGFGHDGFDERFSHLKKSVPHISNIAENVAYGNISTKEIVNGWLHSPGHKKNIEGNYNLTGVGVSKDKKGVLFYTQIFLYQKP